MSHGMQAWLRCTGDALHARFCTLAHNIRIASAAEYECTVGTCSLSGSTSAYLRRDVLQHDAHEHLAEFLKYYTFTNTVDHSISELLDRTSESQTPSRANIDVPVKAIVGFLNGTLETTFSKGTAPSTANSLGGREIGRGSVWEDSARFYAMGEGKKREHSCPRLSHVRH
eukprot:208927-Pleurochrysis_carterae.AAC.1